MVWCADVDAVDVVSCNHLAKVLESEAGSVAVVFVHDSERGLAAAYGSVPVPSARAIHVANDEDAHAPVPQEPLHPVRAVVARADESDRELVAGSVRSQHSGRNDSREAQQTGLENRSSRNGRALHRSWQLL